MDREISDLYDEYLHTPMGRRTFMQKLTMLAGSTGAAYAALSTLEGNAARADQVAPDDPGIVTEDITYPGPDGDIMAYQARPAGVRGKLPAVIVLHANRGLWPHFKDTARKMAVAGYHAVAPDMLSRDGGTPQTGHSRGPEGDAALERLAGIPATAIQRDLLAAVDFLKKHHLTTGKVGAMGFCWGGGHVLQRTVDTPHLDAAVGYYGDQPSEGYDRMSTPILCHYAADDARLVRGIPDFVEQMEANNNQYELYIYPGTRHAFNQDNRPDRYDMDAAYLAWSRTLDFFEKHLA